MVRCGSKNGHQKYIMCIFGLRAQTLLTILGSTVNIIGGDPYDQINEHEHLHVINE